MEFENYFYVTGIRRSGNHAIQTWLTGLPKGPVVKLNLCPSLGPKRLKELQDAYRGPATSLVQGAEELCVIRPNRPTSFRLVARNEKQVLILRNPLNNMASKATYNKAWFLPEHVAAFLGAWVQYAKEFLGLSSGLPDRVSVNFDRWFAEETYRRELAGQLGVEFSDSKLNEMDTNWGISSFDAYEFQGRAQEMPVLDRWRRYVDNPRFHAFVAALKVHPALGFYRQVYGPLPEPFRE
jgi:hypothetical protein